jgi:hypothetical protein
MMNKVHKLIVSECYAPSSKPFRNYKVSQSPKTGSANNFRVTALIEFHIHDVGLCPSKTVCKLQII